jgi:hypothetical protein
MSKTEFVHGVRRGRDGLRTPQYGSTYGKRQRERGFNVAARRVNEITRLIQYRHGGIIPETDDDDTYVWPVAHHLAFSRPHDFAKPLAAWCERHAPHFSPERLQRLVEQVGKKVRRFKAGRLGEILGLTPDERRQLGITTIRPKGMSQVEFQKIAADAKRERDRLSAERRRRERGVRPRAEYLAQSLTRRSQREAKAGSPLRPSLANAMRTD